jgi:hypothetical protein
MIIMKIYSGGVNGVVWGMKWSSENNINANCIYVTELLTKFGSLLIFISTGKIKGC